MSKITTIKLLPGSTTLIKVGWRKYIEVKALFEFEVDMEVEMNKSLVKLSHEVGNKMIGLDAIINESGSINDGENKE